MKFKTIMIALLIAVIVLGIYLFTWNSDESVDEPVSEDTQSTPLAELETEVVLLDSEEGQNQEGSAGYDFAFSGEELAGKNSPLIDFNEGDYQKALESGKTVFLYFYAKWCPTCKRELRDALVPAFNEYANKNVVGFRVNYDDRDTDDFEEQLAADFGVVYQHTKVILKDGEFIESFPNSWTKEEYLSYFESN